ncbi:MAG: NAD(P)H-binding protein [Bryobacterales bacterium]|nr:NAD(P)H-binding protein [Bryobacterales bacterium]
MGANVFVTGGTGYIGRAVIPRLVAGGWDVRAVVRAGSEAKLPPGCTAVRGDVLDGRSYAEHVRPGDTFVHLVGVPRPSPWKGPAFEAIDYVSAREAIDTARKAQAGHFVYVSVAHPAPVMGAYWRVRARCEELLRASGLRASVLRPWYVLGPGHWWPAALKPLYFAAERIRKTQAEARRLGLVTIDEMTGALERAVREPGEPWRVWGVEEIRAQGRSARYN